MRNCIVTDIRVMGCCGIKEIVAIKNRRNDILGDYAREVLLDVCSHRYERTNNCAFYVFTDIEAMDYGPKVREYIHSNMLGDVSWTGTKINPNSKHLLQVWVWAVDERRLKAFWKREWLDKQESSPAGQPPKVVDVNNPWSMHIFEI